MAHRWQTERDRPAGGPATAFVVLIIAIPSLAEDRPATRPIQIEGKRCVAADCHDTLIKPKYLHGPVVVDECHQCHQETDRVNHKYRMVADTPALCFSCHEVLQADLRNRITHPYRHEPVDGGKCLDCHDPHASSHPMMLLKDSIVEMCMSCHKDKMTLAGQVHKPIEEKGCLECHRGHRSDVKKLLRAPREDLCLRCHADRYQESASRRSVHKPFQERNCVGCHAPHASVSQKLLAKAFSTEPYVAFDERSYELCFSCHKKELATHAVTTEATNFRNWDQNLHALHVNKASKGRSCRICHLAHGSDSPRLIRPRVPFGEWEVGIRYAPTAAGGYCGPACHPAKRYDRLVPIDLDKEPAVPGTHGDGP